MRNALESNARSAMRGRSGDEDEPPCWQVEVETNVFFADDKSSFLTPDFFIRRCLPRGADTTVADVVVVGEVLSGSDTPKRRSWKMDRYAEAGVPWYWEVELDSAASWDISAVRAYELLRPEVYVLVEDWEPATPESMTSLSRAHAPSSTAPTPAHPSRPNPCGAYHTSTPAASPPRAPKRAVFPSSPDEVRRSRTLRN
jgi:hypothetical protein